MNNNSGCLCLGEGMKKTNLLLESYEQRMSIIQNQIEGLSKIVSEYCHFKMKSKQKTMKSIGLQVGLNKIDSKLPETNEDIFISQEKEDRSQPATKPLQHDYADVGKSFTSFAEGQVWASNKQEQSLKKKSRESFVEDPDSRTSSGVMNLAQIDSESSNELSTNEANPLFISKNVVHSPNASLQSINNNVPSFNLSHLLPIAGQSGAIRYDMNIPAESISKMPRRNVIMERSGVINSEVYSSTSGSSSTPTPTINTRSSSNQSHDSTTTGHVETTVSSSASEEFLDQLPCARKPNDPSTVASDNEIIPSSQQSRYRKRPYYSSEGCSTNYQQAQQKLDTSAVLNPKPLLAVQPTKEWIPFDENILLEPNSRLERKIESLLDSYPSSSDRGALRRLTKSPTNKPTNHNPIALTSLVISERLSGYVLERQPAPTSIEDGSPYLSSTTSTPSPPPTRVESSNSCEGIQQKMPALVAISEDDQPLSNSQSNPSTTAVSVLDLNRLIRFKPVLRLRQFLKDILVTWDIPDLNGKQSESIKFFELYGRQENPTDTTGKKWIKLSTMKSLRLPMECRLFNFTEGCRYCFCIRTVLKDEEESKLTAGPFSESCSILFN